MFSFASASSSSPAAVAVEQAPTRAAHPRRTHANSCQRGDYFALPRGGVGKRISTGGAAPRKMMRMQGAQGADPPAPPPTPEQAAAAAAAVVAAAAVEAAQSELERCCAEGDTEGLDALLASPLPTGFDMHADDSMPLRIAAAEGHASVVSRLLTLTSLDAIEPRALFAAAMWGHDAVVKVLLLDGRTHPSADTNTALEFAIERGHGSIVDALIHDVRFDATAELGRGGGRLLRIACLYGVLPIVSSLLSVLDPAAGEGAALQAAAEAGSTAVVSLLLGDPRVDPSVDGCGALREAVRGGRLDVLPLLCGDPRVDVAGCAGRLLASAVAGCSLPMLDALLAQPGVSPSAHRNVALRKAVYMDRAGLIAYLLRCPGVDLSTEGSLPGLEEVIYRLRDTPLSTVAELYGHPSVAGMAGGLRAASIRRAALQCSIMHSPGVKGALLALLSPADAATVHLQAAAFAGKADAVTAILTGGLADPAADDGEAVVGAAASGSVATLSALLADHGVDTILALNCPTGVASSAEAADGLLAG